MRRIARHKADVEGLPRFRNPAGVVVNLPEGLIQKVIRVGEPENSDVSRNHIVADPLHRRESFASSGGKDKQAALSLIFGEVEALFQCFECIQLMLERGFLAFAACVVAKIVQNEGMKAHGVWPSVKGATSRNRQLTNESVED